MKIFIPANASDNTVCEMAIVLSVFLKPHSIERICQEMCQTQSCILIYLKFQYNNQRSRIIIFLDKSNENISATKPLLTGSLCILTHVSV